MAFMIPKTLKEETKVYSKPRVYLKDVCTIGISALFFWLLSRFVYAPFTVLYVVFSAVSSVFLLLRSKSNPGKRNWEAIYLIIMKDNGTYYTLNHHDWRIKE